MPHTKGEFMLPVCLCIINAISETREVEEIEKEPFLNNTLRRGSDGMSHFIVTGLIKRLLDQKLSLHVGDLKEFISMSVHIC